ncbi:hypothetical protein [Nitrospira moscoviensis]|nr:hypothetical protein [Nitrospira moscoviensis]
MQRKNALWRETGGRSRDHDLFNLDEAAWGTSDAAIVQQWNRGLV